MAAEAISSLVLISLLDLPSLHIVDPRYLKMASGGYQPTKQGRSEPKRQTNWHRSVSSDHDDVQSLNSLPGDMRINNWDLSDLYPSNLGGDPKRHKKSKGNPEREREQSLSMESPPREKKKHHTPSSYPRTKITPSTPTSQREALENLKQHMTFSDVEEDHFSTDSERNNERQVSHSRRRLHIGSVNRTGPEDDARGARQRHMNRNNNMSYSSKDQGPDSNEVVARLTQIRNFMKQARLMLESMEKHGDQKRTEDVEKVRKLIRNLQEQEQGYRGLLRNSFTAHRDNEEDEAAEDEGDKVMQGLAREDSDDDTSVDLEIQTETTETSQDSRPRIESKLRINSDGDEEDESHREGPLRGAAESSVENSNFMSAAELESALFEGRISHSGVPIQESEEGARGATAVDGEGLSEPRRELLDILREKQQQLQALMSRQEELSTMHRETAKKLMEAKAKESTTNTSLAAVAAGRQFLEDRLPELQILGAAVKDAARGMNEDEEDRGAVRHDRQLQSNIVGYPGSDDEDNSKVFEVENLPNKLLELKRQLNYLRNEFSQISEGPKNVESEADASTEGRQLLQNKLHELQNKKYQLDKLLQELQMDHSEPSDSSRNNETNSQTRNIQPTTSAASSISASRQQHQQKQPVKPVRPSLSPFSSLPTNLQAGISEVNETVPKAVENAMALFAQLAREADGREQSSAVEPQVYQEVQEKLRSLKAVQDQLNHLRSLVQYHQGQQDEMVVVAEGEVPRGNIGSRDAEALRRQANPEARDNHSSLQQQRKHQPQQQQKQQSQHQQQVQHQAHQKHLPPHNHHQQQKPQGKIGGVAAVTSSHNMTQFLNLAGTDQGDEHSDEDNASVSKSESVWSVLESLDNDPDILEKIRKLKSAKEKLHQLQDLVALAQQSPDAARAVSENAGNLAANAGGEAASHSTQTDEPNLSVSERELPSESLRIPHRDDDLNELEDPRAELEHLRKERAILVEIQNQLQRIQNQKSGAQSEEIQERAERNSQIGKPVLNQTTSAAVVTFASNDELYGKIRRQRILHEELRSKKKELEAIMKKDRNRKQYSRNQDNQSDNVSMNTDTFGIAASVDATMATWGGSTMDNLENITEDEDGQERCDDADGEENNEDYGYPSDGGIQIGEEDRENDTDNGTPAAERDAGVQKNMRKGTNVDLETFAKISNDRQAHPLSAYVDKPKKNSSRKQSNSSRNSQHQQGLKSRREGYLQPPLQKQDEEAFKGQDPEWFKAIETRLSGLMKAVNTLLKKSKTENFSLSQENAVNSAAGGLMYPMPEQMLQLQNQSMMLSFGQLVQALTRQQGDIQHLQQQMQALQLQIQTLCHERGFRVNPAAGVSVCNSLRPPQPSPTVSTSSRNHRAATGALSTIAATFNHRQMPSPLTQRNLNNMALVGLCGNRPAGSPGLPNVHNDSPSIVTHNFSEGGDRRHAGGASSGRGADHIVSSGSDLPLPQQRMVAGQSGTQVRNSVSSTSSGLRVSVPSVGNSDDGRNSGHRFREQEVATDNRAGPGTDVPDCAVSFDAASSYSSTPSIQNQHSRFRQEHTQVKSTDSAADGTTLFDTLRDTIYAEVASLISQNESRPYFLLELFRDIRQVDSDYMRQQTLNSVQDLLRSNPRFNVDASSARLQEEISQAEKSRLKRLNRNGSLQNVRFDYAEFVDNQSSLPMPVIGSEEYPTFQDSHGETVLAADSLKREGGVVRQKISHRAMSKQNNQNQADRVRRDQRYIISEQRLGRERTIRSTIDGKKQVSKKSKLTQAASNSATDQASDSSLSDMTCPRIDMKQLDHHVKGIMLETVPLVKEHLSDICSIQLLSYIRHVVISFTSQMGDQEFVRLFQRQLATILEGTLQKYEGRRMKDCGEDLLLDISDVLFNELAFFRLMQNLDDRTDAGKVWKGQKASEYTASSSATGGPDDNDDESNRYDVAANGMLEDRSTPKGFTTVEQEAKSKEQDVLVTGKTEFRDLEKRNDDKSEQPYMIELAQSGTKPVIRTGSDEDNDEGDGEWSINDPSGTAVSRDAMLETSSLPQGMVPPIERPETEGAQEDGAEKQDQEKPVSPRETAESEREEGDVTSNRASLAAAGVSQMNGTINGENNDSREEPVVDDSSQRLAVHPAASDSAVNHDTPELRGKYEEEQSSLNGLDAILASLGGMEELAGDEVSVLDPDTFHF